TGKIIYKWAKNPDVLPKSVLFSEKIEASEFRDGYGYAVFISEDKKFRYVTAASDSDREFYLSGYKKIFIATVSLGVFAGLLVPFLFSLALNSQVQKIDGKEKKFVITEFYDLNQTFRIMQESLMNIKKRNSGMLRSGISLMEKYRQQ
ncbi:MAG: hypothetical protein OEZ34_11930, partial [Spirochaetia bacterium]|nr:hypothetical protein [Spirochaetia bacterium]